MVHATILESPMEGAKAEVVDSAAAMAVPGVTRIIPMPFGVAVLGTTVEALFADLVIVEHDYADDLMRLADAMVDDDRTSGECTVDVLDDPDAGGSDHWDRLGIIVAAERIGISRGTVCAMGIVAIRTAYAAAWRATVELELASRAEQWVAETAEVAS